METNTFIIKPISTSFDIIEMRQLIAGWRMAGLSNAHITKMQLLFFGEPAWMNLDGMYDASRFQEIALGLKYHCRNDFLEVLLKCKGFGKIWRDDKQPHTAKNLMAFYTPLWHAPKDEDMGEKQGEKDAEMQNDMQKGVCYNITEDIIYKKKNNKKKNDSYHVSTHQNASPMLNAQWERQARQTATELLQGIAENDDAYAQIVKPINDQTQQLMPELYCNPKEPRPMNDATREFFNQYVFPYLLEHASKMMKITSIEGRSCWLRNLLKYDFMQKNILRAVNDTRKHLALHAEEMRRQNRPISPHEYQDQKTGQRFYDTFDEKGLVADTISIPAQAEPRPSAEAIWNKFQGKWKSNQ